MKRAVFPMTDEERAEQEAMFKRIMHEAQQFEPEEIRRWNPIAIVVFVYAAVICFVLGWIAAERFF